MVTIAALAIVGLSSAALFAFGSNVLFMTLRSLRVRPWRPAPVPPGQELPVCVQLPVYNEMYVAERALAAVAALDWPRDLLEVQVLDDSDDATVEVIARAAERLRRRGIRVEHVRRASREGYKAGALAHGMTLTRAPYLAVFDADFVPPRAFLRDLMGAFADPRVGFAQARWGHLNRDQSLLTRLQALAIDFHFLVEQAVRSAWHLTNFTGTAGIWRRAAIEGAGGWSAQTLTEDLDLSYRAQLAGWRAAYCEGVVVPEELPVSIEAYQRQQARWATGSFQCARRLLVPVLRSPRLGRLTKLEAVMHLGAYGVGPLMLLQLACYPLLLLGRAMHDPAAIGAPWPVWLNAISLAPWVGMVAARWRLDGRWWRGLPAALCQLGGAGMSVTVLVALVRAFRGGARFERTAKFGGSSEWRRASYTRLLSPAAPATLATGAAAMLMVAPAVRLGDALIAVYAGLLGTGLVAVGLASVLETLEVLALRSRRSGDVSALRSGGAAVVLAFLSALLLLGMAQLADPFEDPYQHWLIAATLAQTGHLRDPLFGMQDTWLPGYHLLAAWVLKVAGLWNLGALKLVSGALALGTLELVRRLAGGGRRGFLAAALAALNPVFLLTATGVLAEPLMTALLAGSALAAVRRRMPLAGALAAGAAFTGTKAWIWIAAAAAFLLGERLLQRRPAAARPTRLAWAAPAVVLPLLCQAAFAPASHSLARGAVEVASATARGSLTSGAAGRASAFLGFSALALLPLAVPAALGAARALRDPLQRPQVRFLHVPTLTYLVVVVALVAGGLYSGSQRYLYPAVPGLAVLAALGLERAGPALRVGLVAAAAALAAGYLPVFASLSADNAGLAAAGRAAAAVPGPLLTDSPVAAFESGKPPAQITGSQALPPGRAAAVAWLRARGFRVLVLEGIDYYASTAVFPDLAAGRPAPPFAALSGRFDVPGGKPVHAYLLEASR